jgi:hypothetical protein
MTRIDRLSKQRTDGNDRPDIFRFPAHDARERRANGGAPSRCSTRIHPPTPQTIIRQQNSGQRGTSYKAEAQSASSRRYPHRSEMLS